MEARHYRELLDIQESPRQDFNYYKSLKFKYDSIIEEEKPKRPEPPSQMKIDLAQEESKRILKNIFKKVKGGVYG